MIEMFGGSNESSLGNITNLLDTVNRNDTAFNDTVLLLPAVANGANESSLLLSGFVANATAVVVDNAAQWLATTIATTSSNLIGFNTESTAPVSVPYTYNDSNINYISPSLTSSYLNLTNLTTSINNDSNDPTANPTYTLSSDLMGGTTELADDNNIYDSCHPSNPSFNCSRMDYILFLLGPQTMPLYTSLMITILYGGIFITGFLGNVLVCIVIVKHSAMHTATNYYLFNLAVSDLIYLIFGLPAEVFSYWHQYPYLFGLPFCKARAYISEASTYVSVLTIVAFSVERYLAICHPLHKYALSGFKRALRIIALLWVISFIGAIPFGIWTKINYSYYPPDKSEIKESGFCGFDTPEDIPLFEVSSLIFFFIPMFLLIYFYGRMGAKIYSRTTQKLGVQKGSMHRESRYQQSRKAVIRMLTAVVVTFFICWLPFHIQRLWCVHGNTTKYYQDVNEWLYKITGFAYYVTCTINPILYNVMSHRYRVAFKDILCGFSREQSSFRETTIATTSLCNSTYDRMHSVRIRSVRLVNNVRDRSSINSNNILWKKSDFNMPTEKDIPESHSTNQSATNALVVCVDNGAPGRTKVFTESEAHETLLRKDDETCI